MTVHKSRSDASLFYGDKSYAWLGVVAAIDLVPAAYVRVELPPCLRINMCVDICASMHADLCVNMCIAMCIGRCTDMDTCV